MFVKFSVEVLDFYIGIKENIQLHLLFHYKNFRRIQVGENEDAQSEFILTTEDGRSMTIFYYCSVNHQSGLQSNTFLKLSYIF